MAPRHIPAYTVTPPLGRPHGHYPPRPASPGWFVLGTWAVVGGLGVCAWVGAWTLGRAALRWLGGW